MQTIFILFCSFILLCGLTHAMAVWNLWHADYWVSAWLKTVTALVSLLTAGIMIKLGRLALSLPNAEQLQAYNRSLEQKVARRTRDLEEKNAQLERKIQEHHETQQALQKSSEFLRAILETVPDGVITIDANGCVQIFNPAAQRMFARSADEVIDQNVNILMPQPYHAQHDRYLANYHATGKAKIINIGREVTALRSDGKVFPIELAVGEVRLDEQRFYAGVIRDISARKQAERDLYRAKAEAESANRAKSEFLAKMSHEIRTPMNGVLGMAEVLAHTALDEQQRHCLRVLQTSSRSLLDILNNVLDIAKIESGELSLQETDFDPSELATEGLAICREIIALMRGELGYDSNQGSGTTFWFTICLQPPVGDAGAAQEEISIERLSGKVLLAEDNLANQEVARLLPGQLGLRTQIVGDGKAALVALRAQPFDVVLMDCQMPELDGYQANRKWRRQEQQAGTGHIPIVALTANVVVGAVDACLEAGMDDYLSKPFTLHQLYGLLVRWLPPAEQGESVVVGESATVARVAGVLDKNVLAMLRSLPEGPQGPALKRLLDLYLEQAPGLFEQAQRSFATSDLAGLGRAVHQLISSSANLGAQALAGYCRSLEQQCLAGNVPQAEEIAEFAAAFHAAVEAMQGELQAYHPLQESKSP